MKKHTKIYMEYFNYTIADFIPCEICFKKSVDIHHVEARSMGGDPTGKKDNILNLMALCRTDHELYGDKKQHKDYLKNTHLKFMQSRQPEKTEKILLQNQID